MAAKKKDECRDEISFSQERLQDAMGSYDIGNMQDAQRSLLAAMGGISRSAMKLMSMIEIQAQKDELDRLRGEMEVAKDQV